MEPLEHFEPWELLVPLESFNPLEPLDPLRPSCIPSRLFLLEGLLSLVDWLPFLDIVDKRVEL